MIEVNPRVKDALRSGAYRKSYRINVLNDDGTTDFTLNNTELVSESVKIDERMCSGDTLKFGLCEGSSIEFQYFNHDNINHPNIRGRRIQVFVDVQYKDSDGELDWESIPLGFFDVQECSTQFSTGIIKAVAYNKLRSEYLDSKVNDKIIDVVKTGLPNDAGELSIGLILSDLLDGYTVFSDYETSELYDIRTTSYYNSTMQYLEMTSAGGSYTGYGMAYLHCKVVFASIANATSDKVYRMNINAKRLNELLLQYWNIPFFDNVYRPFIHYTSSSYDRSLRKHIFDYTNDGDVDYWFRLQSFGAAESVEIKLNVDSNYKKDNLMSGWITDIWTDSPFTCQFPIAWKRVQIDPSNPHRPISIESIFTQEEIELAMTRTVALLTDPSVFRIEETTEEGLAALKLTTADAEALPDVTLRELQSAVFETAAEFGQLSRTTDLFEGVTLSRERLFPADDLYPANDLYPQGTSESTFKSMYEKLWTDSVGEQTFRKLYITYKGLDDQQREKEFVLERTVNADGTTDYYCDDNWLFKNLVWTEQQVGDYADAMVLKMRGIKWFPFEMWSAGLPYIEVGDELEIISKDGTYTSYVLQRSLNGIQNLKDTYINGSLDIF